MIYNKNLTFREEVNMNKLLKYTLVGTLLMGSAFAAGETRIGFGDNWFDVICLKDNCSLTKSSDPTTNKKENDTIIVGKETNGNSIKVFNPGDCAPGRMC